MNEHETREKIVAQGRSLFERGLSPGSSGNISARVDGGWLLTPTNSSLGSLDPARLSKLDWDGRHISGDPPSKEAFLTAASTSGARAPARSFTCTPLIPRRSPA